MMAMATGKEEIEGLVTPWFYFVIEDEIKGDHKRFQSVNHISNCMIMEN